MADTRIKLVVENMLTGQYEVLALDVNAFPVLERALDEIKLGLSNFEDTIAVMKEREYRKEVILQAAKQLGAQMADRLEDLEGWHGEERKNRLKSAEHRSR